MRLDDDFYEDDNEYGDYIEQRKGKLSMAYTIVGISVVALLTLLVVLAVNKENMGGSKKPVNNDNTVSDNYAEVKTDDYYISGDTRVASDLDFWDDYAVKPEAEEVTVSVDETVLQEEEDPSTDGKHTLITHEDGSEEWIEINVGLPQNDYKDSNFVLKSPFMLYQENNHIVSYKGVDISKAEDYVDFQELKSQGLDFVMIRLGQRGYSSGELSLDENFEDNIKRANEAGLDVGVYFFSQATTTEEATEEAEFVINSISDNKVSYPVVYYIEPISGVDTRNASVSQIQRTNYAKAFLDRIKEAGYYPMLYGSKEYLIQKYSLGSMIGSEYEYWLDQPGDTPDYPYRYSMWRYSCTGKISGISGYANLDICFTDYSVR